MSRVETHDSFGDGSAVFEFRDLGTLKTSQSGYRVVFRHGNLVAMVDVTGAKAVVTADFAARVGRTIDDKARDRDPYRGPTPVATPVAPAPWVDRGGAPVAPDVLSERLGWEHCDWQSVVLLIVGRNLYVNDASCYRTR